MTADPNQQAENLAKLHAALAPHVAQAKAAIGANPAGAWLAQRQARPPAPPAAEPPLSAILSRARQAEGEMFADRGEPPPAPEPAPPPSRLGMRDGVNAMLAAKGLAPSGSGRLTLDGRAAPPPPAQVTPAADDWLLERDAPRFGDHGEDIGRILALIDRRAPAHQGAP
jgi:hypothetical protein